MQSFDIDCRLCPRLANFLDDVKVKEPTYFARPVPAFGVSQPQLLIVGLAPDFFVDLIFIDIPLPWGTSMSLVAM